MIHHVSLECHPSDAAAHARFWDALGFAEVQPPESLRGRSTWFERDGAQVHLLWTEGPVVAPSGHFALRVDDLGTVGVELEERDRHWGERRVYARAPGGHLIELFEVSPGGRAR